MSYVLYSAIARAGGIDLLLGMESFARPHADAVNRRPGKPYKPALQSSLRRPQAFAGLRRPQAFAGLRRSQAFAGLRRQGGRALIGLGRTLTRWGRHWAPQSNGLPANTNLTFAAK
jgi:hypothetical protein